MAGWVGGWPEGWVGGRRDGWVAGGRSRTKGFIKTKSLGWVAGWVGLRNGWMGGWRDGWAVCEVWVDRWVEGEGKW